MAQNSTTGYFYLSGLNFEVLHCLYSELDLQIDKTDHWPLKIQTSLL